MIASSLAVSVFVSWDETISSMVVSFLFRSMLWESMNEMHVSLKCPVLQGSPQCLPTSNCMLLPKINQMGLSQILKCRICLVTKTLVSSVIDFLHFVNKNGSSSDFALVKGS